MRAVDNVVRAVLAASLTACGLAAPSLAAQATCTEGSLAVSAPAVTGTVVVGETVDLLAQRCQADAWVDEPAATFASSRAVDTISTNHLTIGSTGIRLITATFGIQASPALTLRAVSDAPVAVDFPVLSTLTPVVGTAVTVTPGSWLPVPDTITFQWLADGVDIAGQTTASFTPTEAFLGRRLSVRVTASAAGLYGVGRLTTSKTAAVAAPAAPSAPTLVPRSDESTVIVLTPLTITGKVKAGRRVGVAGVAPGWTVSYQWLRSGKVIKGATAATYKLVAADVAKQLSVRASLTRDGVKPAVQTSSAVKVPKIKATLKVKSKVVADHRVKLTIKVKAKPVKKPKGRLTVKVNGKKYKTYKLSAAKKGKRVVTIKVTKSGLSKVTVTFSKSKNIANRSKTVKVRLS